MSLPTPTSTFNIPSLHDDLELNCRVYYPRNPGTNPARRTYAILAHPYAPLGGSFDDGVVALIGTVLLRSGIFLCTFNFRGAGGSPGRTSWSGKAELGDYVATYAFMLCYVCATDKHLTLSATGSGNSNHKSMLIVGGYSYGSMMVSCMPHQDFVQSLLDDTKAGSAEFEIKSRAEQMGKDYAAYIEVRSRATLIRGRSSLQASHSVDSPGRITSIGGYESDAAIHRISRNSSRRSLDGERVRQSLDRARQKFRRRSHSHHKIGNSVVPFPVTPVHNATNLDVAYLLVSPLLPPVSALTTMFSKPSFERRFPGNQGPYKDRSAKEEKFMKHPTCFIFGDKDVFTSSKKIKKWTDDLHSRANSSLSTYEVDNAGHFWTEVGAPGKLQSSVKDWLSVLSQSADSDIESRAETS